MPQTATATDTTINVIDYSEKSIALQGKGTTLLKDKLPLIGGKYNRFLKCGPGWIFSKKRLPQIKQLLNIQ